MNDGRFAIFYVYNLARERGKFESITNFILRQLLTWPVSGSALVEETGVHYFAARARGRRETHMRELTSLEMKASLRWSSAAAPDWQPPAGASDRGPNPLHSAS
jgi:hypothetical protein